MPSRGHALPVISETCPSGEDISLLLWRLVRQVVAGYVAFPPARESTDRSPPAVPTTTNADESDVQAG
jgi:hypothetical protein